MGVDLGYSSPNTEDHLYPKFQQSKHDTAIVSGRLRYRVF